MKTKKIILAALAVALFTTVSAQDFRYGAKVGLNVANISNMDDEDGGEIKSRTGIVVGVTAEYSISDKSAISAEILYSQQGCNWEDSYTDDYSSWKSETKIKHNYINIPILYNYYITDKIAIKAGLQPGFLHSAKFEEEWTYNGASGSDSRDIEDEINSVDLTIPIGVSYTFMDNIEIEARYNIGLTNIAKYGYYDDYGEIKKYDAQRNNVFTISVGYKF